MTLTFPGPLTVNTHGAVYSFRARTPLTVPDDVGAELLTYPGAVRVDEPARPLPRRKDTPTDGARATPASAVSDDATDR